MKLTDIGFKDRKWAHEDTGLMANLFEQSPKPSLFLRGEELLDYLWAIKLSRAAPRNQL